MTYAQNIPGAIRVFSHRGFGKKHPAHYWRQGKPRDIGNQASGVEVGIERGASVLELDLSRTTDGHIVTAHGIPGMHRLLRSRHAYLAAHPEAFDLMELIDWLEHQDARVQLYLELKSFIGISEVVDAINRYAHDVNAPREQAKAKLYGQLLLYTGNRRWLQALLGQKAKLGLRTDEIALYAVDNHPLTAAKIREVAGMGRAQCKVKGVEQGTLLWFVPGAWRWAHSSLGGVGLRHIRRHFDSLAPLVGAAKHEGLEFLLGTIPDESAVPRYLGQGVQGIVLDDPRGLASAGPQPLSQIKLCLQNGKPYLPASMCRRLEKPNKR